MPTAKQSDDRGLGVVHRSFSVSWFTNFTGKDISRMIKSAKNNLLGISKAR